MKKGYTFGIVMIFLSICSIAEPAPVGNPAKPILEKGDTPFKIGFEFDFVTERDLDVSDEDVTIEKFNWYGGKISYAFADRVEPYVFLGVAGGEFTEKYPGVDLTYETETEFAWGIGATVLLYEFENGLRLGLDGKYRQAKPDIDKMTLNGVSYSPGDVGISDFNAEYSEWQVAIGIAKELGQFVPYAGIKYTDVETSVKATIAGTTYKSEEVNSEEVVGIFVGCDFLPTEDFSLGVEGRFIDETSFSVTLNYRF